jgi:hypothetical protein
VGDTGALTLDEVSAGAFRAIWVGSGQVRVSMTATTTDMDISSAAPRTDPVTNAAGETRIVIRFRKGLPEMKSRSAASVPNTGSAG